MSDAATMTLSAVILPDEISKTLTSLTCVHTPSSAEGWYYKLTDVTTTSADLIDTAVNYIQLGGTSQGEDTGSLMHTTGATDKVKFLFIKNTGFRDDGTSAQTADSVYICFDAGTASHTLVDAIEVGPGESWYGKLNCTIADIHVISGQKANAGTGGGKCQCIVAAIINNV
tara:strand:+ start:4768 stop:5280 length:513 start_codon:yes stop_codon:yes gene_type:complete